jgi:hypothetical protein
MQRMASGVLATAFVLAAGCGRQMSYRPVATMTEGATSVTLATPSGTIQPGRNHLQLSFTGVGDHPRDVSRATIVVRLGPQPATGVNDSSTIQQSPPLNRVGQGVYRTRYDLNAAGPYQFLVTWNDGGKNHLMTFNARMPMTQPTPNTIDQVGGPPAASSVPAQQP